ncbi:hypothetical protein BC835DRAFT_1282676 [Cytidiella melzeri]|nr:hypothetical protein BC835DRAFT_1282676 [Cytidiella melzeri]
MKPDHFTQEDQARLPSFKPHRFGFLRKQQSRHDLDQKNKKRAAATSDSADAEGGPSRETEVTDIPFVRLDASGGVRYSLDLEEHYDKDVYRWAVLYENQRGVMLFSTPYYSRLSLLPIDPPAFTIPSASKQSRRHHPDVSLASYPLPDGDWHWVSRTWMVDMRGDGQSQYDGFEYNWFFRQKKWGPLVGFMSSGGWVRRRRWVRLMMRPAQTRAVAASGNATPALHGIADELLQLQHTEAGATRPPSVMLTLNDEEEEEKEEASVWTGDLQGDWERCHRALMRLDRDGRRLEVWQRWLRPSNNFDGQGLDRRKTKAVPQKQWSEDSNPLPSQHDRYNTSTVDGMLTADTGVVLDPAPREHMARVLRAHGSEILELFIFPNTRHRFVELVAEADLLSDFRASFGPTQPMFDFYSSSQSIQTDLRGS